MYLEISSLWIFIHILGSSFLLLCNAICGIGKYNFMPFSVSVCQNTVDGVAKIESVDVF